MNNQFMMNNPMNNQMINNNNNIINDQMNNMMMNLLMIQTMNNLTKVYNSMKNSNNNVNKMEIVNKNNVNNSNNSNQLNKKDVTYHMVDPENTNIIRITIVFITPAGYKVILNVPANKNLGQILLEYVAKVGVGPNLLQNGLYFLFNGQKLTKADYNKTLSQIGINDMANIIVIDPKFVIGAQ
jgi:ABC-type transport system involved in Fe-S cluster assembly fused permease/ATPase subunit